jgi:hypothetical protein
MRATFTLLMTVALVASTGATRESKVNHFVTIEGVRYRVAVRGAEVLVVSKGALVRSDVATRDRMREAVRAATGCVIADELPFLDGRLRGKLICQ